ncbi:MAG: hypothetical protein ACTSUE_07125 [Promethearchaeota archaeon]
MLAEHTADGDLKRRAAISADILLFIISGDVFKGCHASSKGRAYEEDILTGWKNGLAQVVKLVWGRGTFGQRVKMEAVVLASCRDYNPSDVIIKLGQSPRTLAQHQDCFISVERNGIGLDELGKNGISTKTLDDIIFIWGIGAYTNEQVIDTMVQANDKWGLWDAPFFNSVGKFSEVLPRSGPLSKIIGGMKLESDRTLMGKSNKMTCKTREFMLSTTQSYRPGESSNQQHVWQATLNQNAIVFTTNPGLVPRDSRPRLSLHEKNAKHFTFGIGKNRGIYENRTPTYWAGNNRLPRAAQFKNFNIILYNINTKRAIGERAVYGFTHAFFPRWAFDEVRESRNWIFGQVNDGYVGFHVANPYDWKDPDDVFCHDIISRGMRNAWVCYLGNKNAHGNFDAFQDELLAARITFHPKSIGVVFNAPHLGQAKFSWNGDFTLNEEVIPLDDYPRIASNHCTVPFNSCRYEITFNGQRLILDADRLTRDVEKNGGKVGFDLNELFNDLKGKKGKN